VTIYHLGSRKPLAQLAIGVVPYSDYKALAGLAYPGSIHLLPSANLLVVIPAGRNSCFCIRWISIGAGQVGHPLPVRDLRTQRNSNRGRNWSIRSRRKRRLRVDVSTGHGPAGMKVMPAAARVDSACGLCQAEASVIVRVRAGDGRQIFHSFVLTKTRRP